MMYNKLSIEHSTVIGHKNKKQKIHYVDELKKQINDLVEENRKLRESTSTMSNENITSINEIVK